MKSEWFSGFSDCPIVWGERQQSHFLTKTIHV
jgi:hypothetical protein